MLKFFALLSLSLSFFPPLARAVDLVQIEKDLHGVGVLGTVHGAVESQGLTVFTVRNPKDFFDYAVMSLLSDDPAVKQKLIGLNRHDQVLIKGQFLQNPSPQKHVLLSSLELVKKFESGVPAEPYHHEAEIPGDLMHLNSAIFLVHAVGGDGHILVAEYKDSIVPLFVKNAELTKNLYRNDIVQLHFGIQARPEQPTHLVLDETDPKAVQVLESIQALHGKPASLEGALVLFPKSPEIIFNVFAVDQPLSNGLRRQYTLVNFEDPVLFKKLREKLQAAWDLQGLDYSNGRNKLVANHLRVTVVGSYNVTSPSQANPQVLIHSLDDVQILGQKR